MFDAFTLTYYPGATAVDSIEEAQQLSKTRFCWILDDYNDYSEFDFLEEPVPWEADQLHVWPSQHQNNGGTYLVPKSAFNETNYHSEIIKRRPSGFPKIIHLDHGDGYDNWLTPTTGMYQLEKSRFINDYFSTLKRVVNKNKEHDYLWIVSSVCSYRHFDFTWHPSEWQDKMLHVFPSNEQKFGDTFYINVKEFLRKSKECELLEWYDTLCFQDREVPRQLPPIHLHSHDNHVDAVKAALFQKIEDPSSFLGPVTLFSTTADLQEDKIPTMNLWRPKTRTIMPLDSTGSRVLVPRDALTEITTQMYDYPYIDKQFNTTYDTEPLDIIFLSNGEECANANYTWLTYQTTNKITKVSNINGRVAAYKECARKSTTDWFFVVYAKLKVDAEFNWDWQPDRMQQGKHYIFYADNPITGDRYGHMAMIAFNKRLVLAHDGEGMDFSMHQEHTVVPILSGEALYAGDPWTEWRTAFREVIKLQLDDSMESSYRLSKWENISESDHYYSYRGMRDALFFYNRSDFDNKNLKIITYEWNWLRAYFNVGVGQPN